MQNDRWLSADISDVPRTMHTKLPATVIVLGVVSNEAYDMPTHTFLQGFRINAAVYTDVLELLSPEWRKYAAEGHTCFNKTLYLLKPRMGVKNTLRSYVMKLVAIKLARFKSRELLYL